MRNEITPDQIMEGDASYSLEEFLQDLFGEVKSSISKDELRSKSGESQNREFEKTVNEVFRFVSEICFKAAINSPDLQFVLKRTENDETEIIRETLISHKQSIALLRALLMRQVSAGLESGLTKRQAAKQVITQNKGILVDFLGKSARKCPK
jgi:hypothetical protein